MLSSVTPGSRYPFPLIVLVAPSGAGKTTLGLRLQTEMGLPRIISCTTREKREDESATSYVFLSKEAFRAGIERGEFAEWEELFNGTLYGRRWQELDVLKERPAFADMTEHGVRTLRHLGVDVFCIRIKPLNYELPPHAIDRSRQDKEREQIAIHIDAVVENDHAAPDGKGLDRAYEVLANLIQERVKSSNTSTAL